MSHTKFAMLDGIVRKDMRKEFASIHAFNYNKESGEFSFKTAVNIIHSGIGQFPFFESLDHILLPYLLESVNQYLVWCEDDEIIHLDESGNPTDDMSLDSKEFNEIMVCTDLTDMLQNHFQTQQKSNPKGFPNP